MKHRVYPPNPFIGRGSDCYVVGAGLSESERLVMNTNNVEKIFTYGLI